MNVLSLFNGMECASLCLEQAEIPVTKMYASEIDKFCNVAAKNRWPNTIHVGCVEELHKNRKDVEWLRSIDIVLAGSPCQGFSNAGVGKNFDDPRSRLFFHFIDILEEVEKWNPKVLFMLENVRPRKKEWLDAITSYIGVEPVFIDSQVHTPQMRKRYYWANWHIPQPERKDVFVSDILQTDVDPKYHVSGTRLTRLMKEDPSFTPPKARALTRNNATSSGGRMNGMDLVLTDIAGNPKPNQAKAGCLTGGAHSGGNHSDMDIVWQIPHGYNQGGLHAKSPTLTSHSFEQNNLVVQRQPYQQDRITMPDAKQPALLAQLGGRNNVFDGAIIRRYTPAECLMLQGMPADYLLDENGAQVVSDSQAYKMIGNGWQCDTIIHIFKHMPHA